MARSAGIKNRGFARLVPRKPLEVQTPLVMNKNKYCTKSRDSKNIR